MALNNGELLMVAEAEQLELPGRKGVMREAARIRPQGTAPFKGPVGRTGWQVSLSRGSGGQRHQHHGIQVPRRREL